MTRARTLADYVNAGDELALKAPLANPTFTGTTTVSGDLVPATPLSHRNLIINGGMQVWQRATGATDSNNGYRTADRYYFGESGDGAYTSQKYDMSMADLNTTGHRTALQLNCTTADASVAASHNAYIRYRIEGQDLQQLQYGTASAKTMTLSFWVKSNKTGTYCMIFVASHYLPIEYTISSADTWEKKVITISPTAGGTSLKTTSGGAIAMNQSFFTTDQDVNFQGYVTFGYSSAGGGTSAQWWALGGA